MSKIWCYLSPSVPLERSRPPHSDLPRTYLISENQDFDQIRAPLCFFANYTCRQIAAFSGDESSVSTSAEMQIVSSWLNSAVRSRLIYPLFAHCEQCCHFAVIKRVWWLMCVFACVVGWCSSWNQSSSPQNIQEWNPPHNISPTPRGSQLIIGCSD